MLLKLLTIISRFSSTKFILIFKGDINNKKYYFNAENEMKRDHINKLLIDEMWKTISIIELHYRLKKG